MNGPKTRNPDSDRKTSFLKEIAALAVLVLIGAYVYFMVTNAARDITGRIDAKRVIVQPAEAAAGETEFDFVPALFRESAVYVMLDCGDIPPTTEAASQTGDRRAMVGKVTAKGRPMEIFSEGRSFTCLAAYKEWSWIPKGTPYTAMTPAKFCRFALADERVNGIVIDPHVSLSAEFVDRTNIGILLSRLPPETGDANSFSVWMNE